MIKKLLVLVVVVIALVLIVTLKKKADAKNNGQHYALDAGLKSKTMGFKIIGTDETVEIKQKDKQWVTGIKDFPADTGKVARAIKLLFELQNKEVISRNPERAKEYGLDSLTRKRVEIYDVNGKTLKAVYIGKNSGTDYNSNYWKMESGDEVYITPGAISFDFSNFE